MASEPILLLNTSQRNIIVRARLNDDFVENEILLGPILATYRRNDDPIIPKLLDLFESVIKRTVNEFRPHEVLNLDYKIIANDDLDHASVLSINLNSVKADETEFNIKEGQFTISNLNADRKKKAKPYEDTIHKEITTPKIVLKQYKELYKKRQEELKRPKRQYVGESF